MLDFALGIEVKILFCHPNGAKSKGDKKDCNGKPARTPKLILCKRAQVDIPKKSLMELFKNGYKIPTKI
ncbi:MAG: hypothetical protein JWN56_296 [Sphingobacteriales bacterium]|nr:hypothetical protein [Sphingobacteriales bacterium]